MNSRLQRWIEILYGPYFRIAGFLYRTYTTNRNRLKAFKAREKVSAFIRIAAVIILFAWLAIWFFASEESRQRLTEEVKKTLGGVETPVGE